MNKIGRMRNGSPICLITSMITDRIGRHEVLLPIIHYNNKICYILGKGFREVFTVLSYYTDPLVLKSGQLIANQI